MGCSDCVNQSFSLTTSGSRPTSSTWATVLGLKRLGFLVKSCCYFVACAWHCLFLVGTLLGISCHISGHASPSPWNGNLATYRTSLTEMGLGLWGPNMVIDKVVDALNASFCVFSDRRELTFFGQKVQVQVMLLHNLPKQFDRCP